MNRITTARQVKELAEAFGINSDVLLGIIEKAKAISSDDAAAIREEWKRAWHSDQGPIRLEDAEKWFTKREQAMIYCVAKHCFMAGEFVANGKRTPDRRWPGAITVFWDNNIMHAASDAIDYARLCLDEDEFNENAAKGEGGAK